MRHAMIIAMLLGGSLLAAQQAPPRTAGDQQPGRKWTEDQLKQYSSVIRAGRKLTPKVWPNGARVAVALTFTVSNTAANLARGDSAVVQLTGGEFGAIVGLPRVLEVLDRHAVPATFFIPATAAIVDPEMIPEIVNRGRHEIGTMGWSDENPLAIDNATEEERLLMKAVDYLTKASGVRPTGARGPASIASLHTHSILERNGFLYDSTLAAMDEPYQILINGRASSVIELPISRILDDQPALSAPRFGPATLPSPELVFEPSVTISTRRTARAQCFC